MTITMTIPIIPKSQARPRHGRTAKGHSVTYKSAEQRQAEQDLIALLAPHRPGAPLAGEIKLGVRAYLPRPQSKPRSWQLNAAGGHIRPTCKPDLDNLLKHVKDCLTQLSFWGDDKQVVEYLPGTGKYYDDNQGPRWEIVITTEAK